LIRRFEAQTLAGPFASVFVQAGPPAGIGQYVLDLTIQNSAQPFFRVSGTICQVVFVGIRNCGIHHCITAKGGGGFRGGWFHWVGSFLYRSWMLFHIAHGSLTAFDACTGAA
jgi:hypothetical protein